MTTVTLSKSADFGGNFFAQNFLYEIKENEQITTTVNSVVFTAPDTIVVTFATEPPSDEVDRILRGVIYSHDSKPAVWRTNPTAFPNGLNITALHRAVKADANIGGENFDGIVFSERTQAVKFLFTTIPTGNNLTLFNSILVNYDQYIPPPRINQQPIPIKNSTITDSTYSLVARFQFAAKGKTIDYIDAISYTANGTYNLRVVDAKTKEVIATKTGIDNTDFDDVVSISAFSSPPTDNTILELYAMIASGKGPIEIDQATIWWH